MKKYIYRRADASREPAIIRYAGTAVEVILATCVVLTIIHNIL